MPTFVLATRNRHKVEEIRAVLGAGHTFLTLVDFPDAPAVVEDAATFAGNARKKAESLAAWLARTAGRPLGADAWVLADDSGLEVDELGGAPGVLSARFAALDRGQAGNSTDAENNAKLLRLLATVPPERRTARFHCALALVPVTAAARPGAESRIFDGACAGTILFAPRGKHGFGYDPLFQPAGHAESFAELGEPTKNAISHRARALEQLRRWLADA
jgi:XTP/dITP diphosphohydrolase